VRRGIKCPRAAIPRGTVDRRFRGNNSGRGANLTLRVGNEEEEEEVVVGRFDDSSKDEDVDSEICLFKGILRVKGDLVGCGSRDSTSSAIGFRTVKEMIIHQKNEGENSF
jgi:hypothetical protein